MTESNQDEERGAAMPRDGQARETSSQAEAPESVTEAVGQSVVQAEVEGVRSEGGAAPSPGTSPPEDSGGSDDSVDLLARMVAELGYGHVPVGFLTVLQAVLFAADRPLSVAALQRILDTEDTATIRNGLRALAALHRGWGYELVEVAGGYQFRTNPELSGWVRRLVPPKRIRLSRQALEVLAVVAYQQPVTRPEIEQIRGVDSGAVLRTLLERGLVRIVGRREEPGRPLLYGTTKEFLEFFGLKSLRDLPSLRDLEAEATRFGASMGQSQASSKLEIGDLLEGMHHRQEAADEEVETVFSEAMSAARKARSAFRRIQERESSLRDDGGEGSREDEGSGGRSGGSSRPRSIEELARQKLKTLNGGSQAQGDTSP